MGKTTIDPRTAAGIPDAADPTSIRQAVAQSLVNNAGQDIGTMVENLVDDVVVGAHISIPRGQIHPHHELISTNVDFNGPEVTISFEVDSSRARSEGSRAMEADTLQGAETLAGKYLQTAKVVMQTLGISSHGETESSITVSAEELGRKVHEASMAVQHTDQEGAIAAVQELLATADIQPAGGWTVNEKAGATTPKGARGGRSSKRERS